MFFYISLALIVAVCAELSIQLKSKFLRIISFLIVIILPSFFWAVRYEVGTDFKNYINIFNTSVNGNENRTEWGYFFINRIIAEMGAEVEVAFFILASIMMTLIYYSIKDHYTKFSLGIGMFIFMIMFYQLSFNAARQALAMAIILYSIKFIHSRQLLKFLLLIFIASSFHNSAWIFLPVYFLYEILGKRNKKFLKFIVYLTILILIFSLDKVLFPILSNNSTFGYYLIYLDSNPKNIDLIFIIRYLPFILLGIYLYKEGSEDNNYILYYSIFIISIILQLSNFVGSEILSRLSWNFEIVLVLLIPYYVRLLNKRNELFISLILLCYTVVHWWYVFIYNGSHKTFPYQWVFGQW